MSLAAVLCAQPDPIQRLPRPDRAGTAHAVRVADLPLVFTSAIAAPTPGGSVGEEAGRALEALGELLRESGSELGRVVRLQAYVAADADVAAVEAVVAQRWAAAPVALTVVRSPLEVAGARVAWEAVAAAGSAARAGVVRPGKAAVLPAGGKVFISGQAEKGGDVASAVRETMAGLQRTLTHLGLSTQDVVQVKAFITPFADHAVAAREVTASFAGRPAPPLVQMEWVSGTLPVEIELVATARGMATPPGDRVAYLGLPWLAPSPRYSKACHVGAGVPLIFFGAVDGDGVSGAREQMKAIFERIGSGLLEAGGSYRNLVKATYYLGDATSRAVLGDIRGVYFDPTRAPAASALEVRSLGRPGRTAQIDLIGFPVKP
ncbi:MAG: RidA family protein [Verrucomicrobia bacterium]|nr:RidA family protein [Verrucomicrobiota bacterium]